MPSRNRIVGGMPATFTSARARTFATRAGLAAAAFLVAGSAAHAASESYIFNLTPQSTLQQELSITLPLAGTWIGNYDAASNPTGTKTIPGLFGGSGNNAIPFSSVVKPEVSISSSPAGSFSLVVDTLSGLATVSDFSLDLLNGDPGAVTINLELTYSNFHTQNPSAIYPGVSGLNLPLPAGSISQATIQQYAPTQGLVAPVGDGTFLLTAALPVVITFTADVLGTPIGGDPQETFLPLAATLVPIQAGGYGISASISLPTQTQDFPAPTQGLENQPFDLPTILPPGNTAHLLISGAFGAGTLTFSFGATLDALGTLQNYGGDVNGDGVVNGIDLGLVIGAWGPAAPGAAADLNHDGVVDGQDLALVISNWTVD